ncbi:MAG: membrane protein insertase YidC [Desulfatitalea sp.]|nr:membrane protein insertase YidC [Desulfatitalea sp.]NNK01787.1 membrane protein insertase YidC [Desulfatitalea sp.]
MEQKRLLLAVGLSLFIFILWAKFFAPKPQEIEEPVKTAETTSEAVPESFTPLESEELTQNQGADAKKEEFAQRSARRITIDTPLYTMTVDEQGAAVISMALKEYREHASAGAAPKQLISKELRGGTVLLSMSDPKAGGLPQCTYSAQSDATVIEVQTVPRELVFNCTTSQNISVSKIFRFIPDSYTIDLTVKVKNNAGEPLGGRIGLALRDISREKSGTFGFQGPSGLVDDIHEQIDPDDIEDNRRLDGHIEWIAIERLYFMDGVILNTAADRYMALRGNKNIIENQIVTEIDPVYPGGSTDFEYTLFMGPKSVKVLKTIGHELDRAVDFGWFDFIAKPCLWFMNFIYRYIPNYGIAIIILTIISRLIFWPLAQKSYKSMNDMRKLAPLMKEIREKYKDDKMQMNQETMALYRTYKVNPVGGCLPMVIQMPVFFALYRMLYGSIELRHAPFFGWIQDLSSPDRLFNFDISLPLIHPPVGIPVLTLIMGATMILQQKMSPTAGDPTQAKMMMLMPVVFTFIFVNFPSGLVLYWLVSNLVAISQQYYTQKKLG